MTGSLIFAVPSKGRLMEQTAEALARVGLNLRKTGNDRGYRGEIEGIDGVEVAFVSASEIAQYLKSGRAHLGITGEDLIRENIIDADQRVELLRPLGFGHADVVVAVPACWLDIRKMADLQAMAPTFRRIHERRLRVATKYTNLTRKFFQSKGVSDYRIVESLGATEGTPASGAADLIVDITTTGATLKANGLKVLEDGVILRSQANLVLSRHADWTKTARAGLRAVLDRFKD
ncbi:MAG: ATP phosphoribosyltransferase [Proteobacteria bacterium]|jgi:ATP phosphoribosyltransferase|nr:MAG: ATP phosphoribosyltransferase [Pseudomonadota bacterium]